MHCFFLENKRLCDKYKQHGEIHYNVVKWLLVGPPGVGKTTTKLRLVGDIDTLKKERSSTGLEPPLELTYIDGKTATLIATDESSDSVPAWSGLGIEKLVLLLLHCIDSEVEHTATETVDNAFYSPNSEHTPSSSLPSSHDGSTQQVEVISTQRKTYAREISYDESDSFVENVLKNMAELSKVLSKELDKSTTVHIIDTGGQPEFHDILPLLLKGPAFYLIFFSLAESLDQPYTIKCTYSGLDGEAYISGHSIKDVICQLLTSVTYFLAAKEDRCDVKPQAFLFATHLDLAPDKVKEVDEELRQAFNFQRTSPLYSVLVDAKKAFGSLFVQINNEDGNEIEAVKAFLTEAVKKACKPVLVPTLWLLFHYILRQQYEKDKVCTYDDSVELALKCGISQKDVGDVLNYINRKLGTILYFDDIPALSHLVICNPEVVYHCISTLIFKFYTEFRGDDIRYNGMVPAEVFTDILEEALKEMSVSELLGVDCITELLEHFKIVVQMKQSNDYFMPCLLQSLPASHQPSESEIDAYPLIVCFPLPKLEQKGRHECKFIPVGLATALVVELQSLPPTTFQGLHVEQPWEFSQVPHYKNRYQFEVYHKNTAVLVVRSKHFELHLIDTDKDEKRKHLIRSRLKSDIESAIIKVCNLLRYTLTPQFYFFCCNQDTPLGQHFARYEESIDQLKCTEVKCRKARFDLSPEHRQWLISPVSHYYMYS